MRATLSLALSRLREPNWIATQRFLRSPQLLIVLVKGFGVSNLFTRTQGNETADANIQPHSTINWLQGFVSWIVDSQANKPTPRRFKPNCDSCRFTPFGKLPRPFHWQRFRTLSQVDLPIFPSESRQVY